MENYVINSDAEGIWYKCLERFSSKEEAIKEGRKQYQQWKDNLATDLFDDYDDDNLPKTFFVGRIEEYIPHIDPEIVVERISEDAWDQVGECAEDYLNDVSKENLEELGEKLNKVLNKWIKEKHYSPSFYSIKDVEEILL